MVHSTLLGCQSLKCIAIDGRNGGKGLRVSLPPVGVPKPSKYGGRSEKKKGGYPHGRPAQCIMICDEKKNVYRKREGGNDVAAPPVPVRYRPGKSLFFAKSYGEGLRKRKGVRYPHGRRPRLVNYTVNKSS